MHFKLLKQNIGWRADRAKYLHPDGAINMERVFQREWDKENRPSPGVNYGFGLLQDLFVCDSNENKERLKFDGPDRDDEPTQLPLYRGFVYKINPREHRIAATVIQWLGTNCGHAFLYECFKKGGYVLRRIDNPPLDSRHEIKEITTKIDSMTLEDVNSKITELEKIKSKFYYSPDHDYEPAAVVRTLRKLAIAKEQLSRKALSLLLENIEDVSLRQIKKEIEKLRKDDSTYSHDAKTKALKTLENRRIFIEGKRKMLYIRGKL